MHIIYKLGRATDSWNIGVNEPIQKCSENDRKMWRRTNENAIWSIASEMDNYTDMTDIHSSNPVPKWNFFFQKCHFDDCTCRTIHGSHGVSFCAETRVSSRCSLARCCSLFLVAALRLAAALSLFVLLLSYRNCSCSTLFDVIDGFLGSSKKPAIPQESS